MDTDQVFNIGPSNVSNSVCISFKANSRLLRELHASDDATIEFTSIKTARITMGSDEYELRVSDINPTVRIL